MNRSEAGKKESEFSSLTPERVLDLVEKELGSSCTNLCTPLASYINRVYELRDREGRGLVAKFYRPGRWSEAALRDEHGFLSELAAQEIPVIAPLALTGGDTLARDGQLFFAVFPKKGGRNCDEFTDDQWLELGRLLGRVHAVGASRKPADRILMAPESSTRQQAKVILDSGFLPKDLAGRFRQLTGELIETIAPMFAGVKNIRIHGDCHFANIIQRPGEGFFLIDFDDMALGPPVQDLWMLLPDYPEKSLIEIDLFLEGYETFRPFDRRTLRLIEPLRAMRFVHYIAWCAHQAARDGQTRVVTDFGSRSYWERELLDLSDQLERIREQDEESFAFYP